MQKRGRSHFWLASAALRFSEMAMASQLKREKSMMCEKRRGRMRVKRMKRVKRKKRRRSREMEEEEMASASMGRGCFQWIL